MRVRTGRFRSGGQGCPPPHDMTRWPCPRHPMLPIGSALTGILAHSGVIGSDILSVVGCQPTSSALHARQDFRFLRLHGRDRAPGLLTLLWPLLTSHGISSVRSPQVRTRCSPAQPPHLPPRANQSISLCCASLSRRVGLLCGSCSSARRFPLAFLPTGRSPFRSWLQVVVSS